MGEGIVLPRFDVSKASARTSKNDECEELSVSLDLRSARAWQPSPA